MSQDSWQPLEEQIRRVEHALAELRRDRHALQSRVAAMQRERQELARRIRRLVQRLREVGIDEQA